jgi:hypothetical protein
MDLFQEIDFFAFFGKFFSVANRRVIFRTVWLIDLFLVFFGEIYSNLHLIYGNFLRKRFERKSESDNGFLLFLSLFFVVQLAMKATGNFRKDIKRILKFQFMSFRYQLTHILIFFLSRGFLVLFVNFFCRNKDYGCELVSGFIVPEIRFVSRGGYC